MLLNMRSSAMHAARLRVGCVLQARCFSGPIGCPEGKQSEHAEHVHFRLSPQAHPLGKEKRVWDNPTQNHVWSAAELDKLFEKERTVPTHFKPQGVLDRLTYSVVRGAYHSFNFLTGFSSKNPTPRSLIYRVLILESIAGCPGMVAAAVRHFRSLRTMQRDGGWIHTLLEEAENERMHLLVFMQMFTPGLATRAAVMLLQYVIVAVLTATYVVRPQLLHRFVGYLEETAVQTYLNVINHLETPGTKVHEAWHDLPAPDIARRYWRLPDDAKFLDVVKQICADEMHHRDVNHEFAGLQQKDFNPFVSEHIRDADIAAQVRKRADAVTEAARQHAAQQ